MTQATLSLRATQQTALTPRLQQSVRLLQLSSNDFALELEQALATNPFLEVPSHFSADEAATNPERSGDPAERSKEPDSYATPTTETAFAEPEGTSLFDDAGLASAADADFSGHGVDQGEYASGGPPERDPDVASWAPAHSTLRMHLHDGMAGYRLSERDASIAELVIESVDDDGYIRQDLSEVAERYDFDPPVDVDELTIALKLVQQIGPSGIAARDLSECLRLQLESRRDHRSTKQAPDPEVVATAIAIVDEHLDLLAARDLAAIRRHLGCPHALVVSAAELVRSLDPRPASAFAGEVAQFVIPDVIVRRAKSGWRADINPAVMPRVGLNRVYAALFHDARGGERQPLGEQLQEARWLLRNTAQRFVTIRRVARIIVAEQAAFLEYGDIAIKPLLLRQVAEQLDLHESTISRAIGNKFMATPRGVFAFKHFFSRKLATVSGGSCSATSIRAAMRELIEREDRSLPLSDVVLAKHLADQGLCVARRTVTKYRGLMRIPPVESRRQDESTVRASSR